MISNQEMQIIENLKKVLNYDASKITQKQFDNMINYIINQEESPKEIVWRLCECYEYLHFNNVIDFFVNSKDAHYLSELCLYAKNDFNQKYLTKKLLETKNLKLIKDVMSKSGNLVNYYLDQKYVNEILSFIKEQ